MALLMVPALDARPWPTLGPDVCDWIEENLVYGPGPLKGEPYQIEPEFRAELYRMYEVFPRGHARQARRRFKRVGLSKRKGTAKTEKAAIIAALEAHPESPVRCDGFRRQGSIWVPVGRPVRSPYIPMVAYTEEQSEELAYGVLRTILMDAPCGADFDIGLDRILVLDAKGREAGKIVALAGSPNARDGAITTWQHFDETHRMYSPRLKAAHTTMLQNAFKRVDADPWTLETTTPGELGQDSIAEDTHAYAEQIAKGKVKDPSLFYSHRFAPDELPMKTAEDVRAALLEATGPATWSADIDGLVQSWFEPKTDQHYYRRVWLCQWVKGGAKAFDPGEWAAAVDADWTEIPAGRLVTLGFDGARKRDSTGIVATDVLTGFQQMVSCWERPPNAEEGWEVPVDEVDGEMRAAFERWAVWRLYADPPYWDEWLDEWHGRWPDKVVRWWTNRQLPMAWALRAYKQAMGPGGQLSHDGNPLMAEHIANAVRVLLPKRNDDDEQLFLIRKERHDSPDKIDLAMAGCLSWEARGDAIHAGATTPPPPARSKVMGTR